ncbi:MAG TPA: PAS domain S-box protein [Desulfomonilia bacterium]|nr:PAS domain S-box protein [Deltaproteobacteria bacterium]HRS57082.1 PAS domain S-box protein [Desulfomonilia bacterium]HRV36650.1 PAS domain S-box protein [Desulfomonilia bacterium]
MDRTKEKKPRSERPGPDTGICRLFFEASRDAFFCWDVTGRITHANPAASDLIGTKARDIPGKDIADLFANPQDAEQALSALQQDGGEGLRKTCPLRRGKDRVDCEISFHVLRNNSGRITGYGAVVRDISAQRLGDEELAKKTAELSKRVRELGIMYEISAVIDRRGRPFPEIVQGVLDLVPRIVAYPEIACARITIDDEEYHSAGFHPTPWHIKSDIMARCGVAGSLEVFYREERPAAFEGPFTREEKGLIDNIASRLGRVVARKRSEEMLVESEERYRSLFEDSRDAIYTVSRDGVILDANGAAMELFGYGHAEMIGMNVQQLYADPGVRAYFQSEIEEKGAVRNFEVRLKKKNGTVMDCLYTSSVRRTPGGGGVIGYHCIIRDITESKRAENEKQRLIDELKDALDKIKTLKGLIPICASCKKIRDDKGYWNRLEEYLEAQTEAVFSHGLCPECQKRFEEE